jgi:hypothetical protein
MRISVWRPKCTTPAAKARLPRLVSRLGFAWWWTVLAFDNTAYVGIAAYLAILGANGFAMMALRTGDFDRNSNRSNGEKRPVAEKVATTTWRDEPAPA